MVLKVSKIVLLSEHLTIPIYIYKVTIPDIFYLNRITESAKENCFMKLTHQSKALSWLKLYLFIDSKISNQQTGQPCKPILSINIYFKKKCHQTKCGIDVSPEFISLKDDR